MNTLNISATDQQLLLAVGTLIILDILSGLIKAICTQNISSAKLRQGAEHKGGFIILIAMSMVLQGLEKYVDLGFNPHLIMLVCIYLIITEITSICENIVIMIPSLKDAPILKLFNTTETPKIIAEVEDTATTTTTNDSSIAQQTTAQPTETQNIIPATTIAEDTAAATPTAQATATIPAVQNTLANTTDTTATTALADLATQALAESEKDRDI